MDLRKEQFVFVLTLNKNVSVKRLDDICKDFLFKRCSVKYFIERPADFKISIYCLTDEFLTKACYKIIYFCKCPNWECKSEIVNFISNVDGVSIPSGSKIDEIKLRISRLVTGISFSIGLKIKCQAQYT